MKKTPLNKTRLSLNKEKILQLKNADMSNILGGGDRSVGLATLATYCDKLCKSDLCPPPPPPPVECPTDCYTYC